MAGILVLAPHQAAADTIDVTLTTGSGTITGSYQFSDDASDSDTIGAWSFDLSALGLKDISSTGLGAVVTVTPQSCSGNPCDLFDFFSLENDFTHLDFVVSEPSDLNVLLGPADSVNWDVNINTMTADITSANLTDVTTSTPEPPSLLLVGLGLISLLAVAGFGTRIRHLAR